MTIIDTDTVPTAGDLAALYALPAATDPQLQPKAADAPPPPPPPPTAVGEGGSPSEDPTPIQVQHAIDLATDTPFVIVTVDGQPIRLTTEQAITFGVNLLTCAGVAAGVARSVTFARHEWEASDAELTQMIDPPRPPSAQDTNAGGPTA